jgi:hypothetical protein
MKQIEYLKLQAKNLFKDYKTKKPHFDTVINSYLYEYDPKYFDIDGIILDFDINEENFSLMKAQHIIARIVGFRKWADLLKASEIELEIAKLLFDNQDKIFLEDWEIRISLAEQECKMTFDPESRLEILKQDIINWKAADNPFPDYRLDKQGNKATKEGFFIRMSR